MDTSATMKTSTDAPKWLKIIAIIGIVWYAFGLLQFWLGYSMETLAASEAGAITAAHAAAIDGTPLLIWVAFAVASGAGLLGSILLFAESSNAKLVFALSVVSAAIYYVWVYVISGTGGDRPSEEIFIAVVVVAVTLGLLFLSRRMT
ncbi:MAG: hypothetical protein WBC93_16720 [Sulfitobacter sp.]